MEAFGRQGEALMCAAPVVIVRGGNRSGLTTTGALEVALTARPHVTIRTDTGLEVSKRDAKPKRICVLTGERQEDKEYGRNQISAVLYPKLFGGPAPMITENEIQYVTWWNLSRKLPESVTLRNETVIHFMTKFPSQPGCKFDLVWLDNLPGEEREIEDILIRSNRFVWTTWPYANFQPLRTLSDMANKTERIREFILRFVENPHIDTSISASQIEGWKALGQDEERVRNQGEFPDGESTPPE